MGVSDGGDISGLNQEIAKFHKKSSDKFLLHIKDLVKQRIGEQFYPYIEYELVDVDGAQVLHIECSAGDKACFLDDTEFYIRTNPATDKIAGTKMIEYCATRFKNS